MYNILILHLPPTFHHAAQFSEEYMSVNCLITYTVLIPMAKGLMEKVDIGSRKEFLLISLQIPILICVCVCVGVCACVWGA